MAGGLPRAVATLGGLGRVPVMPGTLASAVAIPAAWLLHLAGGFPLLLLATVAATLLAFWAARAVAGPAGANPPEVVIDKLAGQWLALWPLSGGLWWMGAEPYVFPWPGWVGGFLLFRLLDTAKPGPIGWLARRGDANGLVLDDLLAGLLTALAMALSAAVAHGVLM